MQPESKESKDNNEQKTGSIDELSSLVKQPQINKDKQRQLELMLYMHFEKLLPQIPYRSTRFQSIEEVQQISNQPPSKELITAKTVHYLAYLKQKIHPLPSYHSQQLIFLIKYFNQNNRLISKQYCLEMNCRRFGIQVNFSLKFNWIQERLDVNKFVSFDWNHLQFLSFSECGWLDDADWRNLVKHAHNFQNIRQLILHMNRISDIQEHDFEQFKSLDFVNLEDNPLNEQSRQTLITLEANGKILLIDPLGSWNSDRNMNKIKLIQNQGVKLINVLVN